MATRPDGKPRSRKRSVTVAPGFAARVSPLTLIWNKSEEVVTDKV